MAQYIGTNTCPVHPDLTTIIVASTKGPPDRGVPVCSTCWEEASDCAKSNIRNIISMWNQGLITTEERQRDIEGAILEEQMSRTSVRTSTLCPCPSCTKQRLIRRV